MQCPEVLKVLIELQQNVNKDRVDVDSLIRGVLIELQQNVNNDMVFWLQYKDDGFNRTTVECKLFRINLLPLSLQRFNRTTVECK